jgi:hypothetical protein
VNLNKKISQNSSRDYAARLNDALGSELIRNANFQVSGKGNMQISAGSQQKGVVACILEIDK